MAERDISELSENPLKPLSQDQIDHIEEYLTLKNHGKSARGVKITDAVDHVLSNLDHYLGVKGTNVTY